MRNNHSFFSCFSALIMTLLVLLIGCGGNPLSDVHFGVSPPSNVEMPKALPANAAPADYDKKISSLNGLLAEAKSEKLLAETRATQAESEAWRTWTRWISALVIPLAIAAGALSLWFGFASLGVPLAGAAILAALGLQAWAEFQGYLLIALAVCSVLGLVIGAIALLRRDRAAVAVAKVGDAIESGKAASEIMAAKIEAEAAQLKAGVFRLIQKARGKDPTPKIYRRVD